MSRTRTRRSRVVPAALLALALSVAAAGCSGEDEAPLAPRTAIPSDLAEPLWNPCDALDPREVADLFGTTFDLQTGTDSEPRCVFTPTVEGETVLDINYQLYSGTLAAVVAELGTPGETSEVRTPKVPGSTEARMILDTAEDALAITALVRNGELVQVVNALDLAPYDAEATAAAVRRLMVELAARAEESGLNTED